MSIPRDLRKTIITAVGAGIIFLLSAAWAQAQTQRILEIDTLMSVGNGPTAPSEFTIDKRMKITYIMTYHWNDGKGAPAGKIGLVDAKGTKWGPWSATTLEGQGGVPNAYWIVKPNVVVPPGTYTITDSSPGTWAQNDETDGRGVAHVDGTTDIRAGATASGDVDGAVGSGKSNAADDKKADDAGADDEAPGDDIQKAVAEDEPAGEGASSAQETGGEKGGLGAGLMAAIAAAALAAILAIAHLICRSLKGSSGADQPPAEEPKDEETPEEPPVEETPREAPEDENREDEGQVTLELTYPAGRSPKVFTTGWVFGARCIATSSNGDERDLSYSVEWMGTGDFDPPQGFTSRPAFSGEGANTIILTCDVDGHAVQKTFSVNAVSPNRYAHVGTMALCEADAHGCPACPHNVIGPVTSGSSLVAVNGQPAARKGDAGTHAACCGPNTFKIAEGDPEVLIEGRPAARIGDRTDHCGGVGRLVPGGFTSREGEPRDADAEPVS